MRNQMISGVLFLAVSAAVPARAWAADPQCGLAASFLASLDQIEAKPAQKASIDSARNELKKVAQAQADARTKLAAVLAEGVEAGKVDAKKVAKAFSQAASAKQPDMGATLARLQGKLDEEQRKRLWQLANEHQTACDNAPHTAVAGALSLSPDLKQKIQEKLDARAKAAQGSSKDRRASDEATRKAAGDSFVSARFDAKKTKIADKGSASSVSEATDDFVASSEATLPLLTADQRAKLAAAIRSEGFEPTARFSNFLCCRFKVSCCF